MNTEIMPIATKKSPASHHAFVTYVINIADKLDGNTSFPNPTPSATELRDLANALATANAKAHQGGPAMVADRNEKRSDLEEKLDLLVVYARSTVRANAASPEAAATMILGIGLSIKKPRTTSKAPLAAKHGSISSEVLLIARAAGKTAMYLWEHSLDQETWTSVPQTMTAKTRISGLTPGQAYYFRLRVQTRKGLGDYSDVVKLIVL